MAENFDSYIKQLRDSTESFSLNAQKLDASLTQLATAVQGTPVESALNKININISDIKALVNSINKYVKDFGKQMQKNLDEIKIPDDVNDAVKKRLTIDKENQVSFKEVLNRLNTLAELDKKKAEEDKATKSANKLQDQKDRTAREQLLYKVFGLVDDFRRGWFEAKRFLASDWIKAGLALFGKELPRYGKTLVDILQIPKIIGLLGEISVGVIKGGFNIGKRVFNGIKSAFKLFGGLGSFGDKASELKTFLKPQQKELSGLQKIGQSIGKFLSRDIMSFLPKGIKEGIVKFDLWKELTFGKPNFKGLNVDVFGKSIQELKKSLSLFNKFKTKVGSIFKGFQDGLKALTTTSKIGSKVMKLGAAFWKKIPVIGAIFSFISGFQRWGEGDKIGASLDILSGLANLTGGGWIISLLIDLINAGRDYGWFDKAGDKVEKFLGAGNPISYALKTSESFNNWHNSNNAQSEGQTGSSGFTKEYPITGKNLADAIQSSYVQKNYRGVGNRTSTNLCAMAVGDAFYLAATGDTSIVKGKSQIPAQNLRGHAENWNTLLNGSYAQRYFTNKGKFTPKQLRNLPAGSVVVWDLPAGKLHSHVEIADGKGNLISDYWRREGEPPNSKYKMATLYTPKGVPFTKSTVPSDSKSTSSMITNDSSQASDNVQISEDRPRTIGDILADAMSELQNVQKMAQSKESQDFFRSLATGTSSQTTTTPTTSPSSTMRNPAITQPQSTSEPPKIVVNADSGGSVPVIDDTSLIMQQLRYISV